VPEWGVPSFSCCYVYPLKFLFTLHGEYDGPSARRPCRPAGQARLIIHGHSFTPCISSYLRRRIHFGIDLVLRADVRPCLLPSASVSSSNEFQRFETRNEHGRALRRRVGRRDQRRVTLVTMRLCGWPVLGLFSYSGRPHGDRLQCGPAIAPRNVGCYLSEDLAISGGNRCRGRAFESG